MRPRRRHALLVHLLTVLVALQGVVGLVPGAQACLAIAACAHACGDAHDCNARGCDGDLHHGAGAHACGEAVELHRHADGVVHRHASRCDGRAHACEGERPAPDGVDHRDSGDASSAGAIEPVRDACACHMHIGVVDADALPVSTREALVAIDAFLGPIARALALISVPGESGAPLRPSVADPGGPPARERAIVATTILLL
jgi:hypothetical protein